MLQPPSCWAPACRWDWARSAPASVWASLIGKALESIARQPEVSGDVRTNMFIGIGVTEAVALYAFVVALILIFVAK